MLLNWFSKNVYKIQVEHLTISVVAFVVKVGWLHCETKFQALLGGNDEVLSKKKGSLPPAATETNQGVKFSTPYQLKSELKPKTTKNWNYFFYYY